MATNGASAQEAFAPVLAALNTMQSNVERAQKGQAHEFLEKFQKSNEAWTTTIGILQAADTSVESKLFAATTLKGKIIYDLHQIPRESLGSLRDTLMSALYAFRTGPKPIRLQLCVCLANLAVQMTEWKDVLPLVISKLGTNPEGITCVLDFIRVLPEEVTDGRKINLSEDELYDRTKELVEDNAQQVLALLVQYSQSSDEASKNPQLLDCIASWLGEVAISDIVQSPIIKTIFNALLVDEPFEAAVECLCNVFRETRDVDECRHIIRVLYPNVVALRPKLRDAASEEDLEVFKGISRIFAEAGEAWVVLIAREPENFRDLVEALLEIALLDKDRDVISFTFNFWYELKQLVVLEIYMQARLQFADVYSKLVDVMIGHLEFPKPDEGEDEGDLFEGDREQEEKFREFRHKMGDVLKDCCEVIGVTECLKKSYELIEKWVQQHGQQAAAGRVPDWQTLEAPLFSMRAMGRMVSPEENIMLPRLIPLIVGIPDQEKVRFQAVMTLGRYTEWTAEHPDLLKPQLDFIMAAFEHSSTEVVRAAALSFKFFCNDCADLLKEYTAQIQPFYANVLNKLPSSSQEEITDGVASILRKLPVDQVYTSLKSYCDPIMGDIMAKAQTATTREDQEAVADKIQLITLFVQYVQPYVEPGQEHPAVKYCQEIFPILSTLAQNFSSSTPILEHVCRCYRYMVLSYRTALTPLLPQLAQDFASGFASSRHSSFLWATDAIIREFSEGVDDISYEIIHGVFGLYEQQATTFLRAMNDLPPEELPDIIEDFFRLSLDALLYYPGRTIGSTLMPSIISAACSALTLLKADPLIQTLHFLRDFLLYGGEFAPSSDFDTSDRKRNTSEVRQAVQQLIAAHGEQLVQRVLTGMMYTFPRDCIPDASGVLLELFPLLPSQTALWVQSTVSMLPAGSITSQESQKFLVNLKDRIEKNELQKVRTLLQDFTTSYRRRNVAPREGLGRLEASRFRFSG